MSMKHGIDTRARDAAKAEIERNTHDPAGAAFVHLHVHSSYSLREGAMSIAKLITFANADAMPALAITDTNNLFGALEFSEKVAKAGLQPIIGIQLAVGFGDGAPCSPRRRRGRSLAGSRRSCCSPKDETGYSNLMHLASRAFLDPDAGRADAYRDSRAFAGRTDGLIALTGGPAGPLDRCYGYGRPDAAIERLATLEDLFRRSALHRACSGMASRREREAEGTR